MSANGTNYRLHMYNPDQIGALPIAPVILDPFSSESGCWLFPFKKVLRDTKINQLTYFVESLTEPPDFGYIEYKVCLYRCIGSLVKPVGGGGRIVAEKVTNSEVGVIGIGVVAQTQWQFPTELNLQGGSYWIGVAWQATNLSDRAPIIWIDTHIGITDADTNILYPKYDVTLATAMTLPATINILTMARKVDNWHYASGEWY